MTPAAVAPPEPQLRVRERLRGWVAFGVRDYNTGLVAGRLDGNRCELRLTVDVEDLDDFLADPVVPARLGGTLRCPCLGGEMRIEEGWFQLLVPTLDERRRRVLYRAFVCDADGRRLTISGFKVVEDDPSHDVWYDTSRVLVRILAGHVAQSEEADDDPRVVAVGVLRLTPLGLLGLIGSMRGGRGRRLSAPLRYDLEFARRLKTVYSGPPVDGAQFDFPTITPGRTPWQGRPPERWHEVPGRPGLSRQIVRVEARDGFELNLHHLGPSEPRAGEGRPVLLIGGLAMRAEGFYGPPGRTTIVDALLAAGHDVWVENWRTSIDLPPSDFTLETAAVFDHPAAVQEVLERTGRPELDAVAHCMGSASLTMSVLAGLVPQLRTVVSSAVSLHVALAARSRLRLTLGVAPMSLFLRGADPQWAARPPSPAAAVVSGWARLVRREYADPLVAATTYIYGGEAEALWRLDNLDEETLHWLSREFGYAPLSFFRQMRRCGSAGHLVPVDELPGLRAGLAKAAGRRPEPDPPAGVPDLEELLLAARPPQDTRFAFLAGAENRFFLPAGQRETYDHFRALRPESGHSYVELPGYSHYDVLIGRNAPTDVFGRIVASLGERVHAA